MKQCLKKLLLSLLFINAINISAQDEDVLFQAFDWNVQNQPTGQTWFNVVTQNSSEISNAGFDMIWLPPVSDSGAPQGYLPRELYNFNSAYGTESQLRNLINTYHNLDVKIIGDIVINHRVGTNDAVTFTNPSWPTTFITADDEGRNFVNYPVEFSINGDYFPGTALKADGSNGTYGPARDLDHYNPAVRQEIKNWMNFLKNDLGFDGWRYDFVHGYDPIFNKEYNDATNPYFAVGELLESSRVQTNNWVNFTQQSSSAFDFNTKVTLQNALRDNNLSYLRDGNGKPSGMIGINPTKSVTFLDNHDTGAAQQCCGSGYVFPSDENNLRKGYAYILTHPGNPMVFWTHYFDAPTGVKNAIKDLISIRKDARVFAGSTINISEARNDLYAAYIDGRNGTIAMKLGRGNWSPNGNNWVLRTSGNDYAVWTQGGTPPPLEEITFRFKKPNDWNTNINAYFFDSASNRTISGISEWPGQTMTKISGTPWYEYTLNVPVGTSTNNIRLIFNDGNNQTDDLRRGSDGWYDTGVWSNSCPSNCTNTPPSNSTVTFNFLRTSSWGNTANVYLYDKNTNTTLTGSSNWPGEKMNNNSNWSNITFDLPNGVSPNNIGVVFNNGNGQQTVDLSRGTDGWFKITDQTNGKYTGIWTQDCPTNCNSSKNDAITPKSNTNKHFYLAPNPIISNANLYIITDKKGTLKVSLTNILGQTSVIVNEKKQSGLHKIPLSDSNFSNKGLFFIIVTLDDIQIAPPLKIIKQ